MYRSRSLKKRLIAQPYTFTLCQAMYLLLSEQSKKSNSFQGYELESFLQVRSAVQWASPPCDVIRITQCDEKNEEKYHLFTQFLGVAGAHAPLPTAYTERLIAHLKNRDTAMADFLDIFSHRFVSLFFSLQQKRNPALSFLPPEHHSQGRLLASLSGHTQHTKNLSPRSVMGTTRIFWKKPRGPAGLGEVLRAYFEKEFVINAFCGMWIKPPAYLRVPLGKSLRIKKNSFLGKRVWAQNNGIEVVVVFENVEDFVTFLPRGKDHYYLVDMIRVYVGITVFFKLAFQLKAKPEFILRCRRNPLILGWTSWLKASASDAAKTCISCGTVYGSAMGEVT